MRHSRGQGTVEKKILRRLPEYFIIQLQADPGKSSIAGIGKCAPETLLSVPLPVIAGDGYLILRKGTLAVPGELIIVGRMFPQVSQTGYHFEGGTGRIESLGRTV